MASHSPLKSFKMLLMDISNRLTKDDVEKMKFGLQIDQIPKGKLQGIQKPFELFDLMMESGCLSADNLNPLAELLQFASRPDLSDVLISPQRTEGEP